LDENGEPDLRAIRGKEFQTEKTPIVISTDLEDKEDKKVVSSKPAQEAASQKAAAQKEVKAAAKQDKEQPNKAQRGAVPPAPPAA